MSNKCFKRIVHQSHPSGASTNTIAQCLNPLHPYDKEYLHNLCALYRNKVSKECIKSKI